MRIKIVKLLNKLTGEHKDIELNLYYNKDRKYYWVSVMPCTYQDKGNYSTMLCSPFDGKNETILRVENRRSTKTDSAAVTIFDANQDKYLALLPQPETV